MRFAQIMQVRRYVASHGKLRLILPEYLRFSSEKIGYKEQNIGRPVIVIEGTEHEVKLYGKAKQ